MTVDSALDKLKVFLFEDDELVTYKWLSKKLGIHVNVSKKVLWEFWQGYERKVDMTVVFIIIGLLKGGSMHVEVVRESNITCAEGKFDNIHCKHIYSLQRASSNLQSLVLANKTNAWFSAIKCKESFIKLGRDLPFLQQQKIKGEKQIDIRNEKRFSGDTAEKNTSKLLKQDISQMKNSLSKNKNIENANKNDPSKKVKNVTGIFPKKPVKDQQAEFQNHFRKAVTANVEFESRESKGTKGKNNSLNAVKGIDFSGSGISMVEEANVMPQEKVCDDETEIKNEDSDQVISTKMGQNEDENNENSIAVKKRKRILSLSNSDEEESVSSEFVEKKKMTDKSFHSESKLNMSESVHHIKDRVCMAAERDQTWVDEDGFLVTRKESSLVHEKVENPNDKLLIQESQKKKHGHNKQTKQTKQTTLVSFLKKS